MGLPDELYVQKCPGKVWWRKRHMPFFLRLSLGNCCTLSNGSRAVEQYSKALQPYRQCRIPFTPVLHASYGAARRTVHTENSQAIVCRKRPMDFKFG